MNDKSSKRERVFELAQMNAAHLHKLNAEQLDFLIREVPAATHRLVKDARAELQKKRGEQ